MIPRIQLHGTSRERGIQYGELARDRMLCSFRGYERAFEHFAGWDWKRVRDEADKYWEPIDEYDDRYTQELVGIADGAKVDKQDVLAINCRTEIMFSAKARAASESDSRKTPPLECSTFAALPHRTREGRLLVGQTWDWLSHATESLVMLEVEQAEGPNYVTVAEAGLLAKFGMNSAGLAVCTNALVCDADQGDPGVPYHVLLRALLDSDSLQDALASLIRLPRASSANYVLASSAGIALDVEAAPGDYSRVNLLYPEDGLLLHTNHFLELAADLRDTSLWAMPDSPFRLVRLRAQIEEVEGPLGVPFFKSMLADHAEYPDSICCHPEEALPKAEQYITAAAVVMDPEECRMWLTDGPPCRNEFSKYDFSKLFGVT